MFLTLALLMTASASAIDSAVLLAPAAVVFQDEKRPAPPEPEAPAADPPADAPPAAEPPPPPMQPLLWIVTVDKTDPTAGSFTASQQMLVYEIAVKQVTRVVNNRTVTETVQVPVEKTISMSMEFAPESWRLLNAQGKAVPKTEVWSRLKPGKAIFVSATSNVAPSYLKAMASDAVVIVRPETPSAPPAPEADIPAPVQAPTARPNSSPRVPPPAPAPPSAPRPRIR